MKNTNARIMEIHKNGLNHWNNIVSYYIYNWNTKELVKDNISTLSECYNILYKLGYKNYEITEVF